MDYVAASVVDPTVERLILENTYYDEVLGEVCWRLDASHPNATRGYPLKADRVRGHLRTDVFGPAIYLHRIAWRLATGCWPENSLDHVNGDKTDNRLINLRDIPHTMNMQNRTRANRNNRSGALGVSPSTVKKGWYSARIQIGVTSVSAGPFPSVDEAHRAYVALKREFHPGNTL